MTTTFPRSSPSELGIDPRGVAALVDALESTPGVEPHSLMILRHGAVAAEGWWAPYGAERPHLLYSLSKSFTAAAVGLAVDEGLLGLDDPVLLHFPELADEVTDERTRRMRVRHLLAMASGHRAETLDRAGALDPDDLVRGFLLLPPDEEPGTVFAYNQPCTYTLGEIVRRVSGDTLLEYLRPRLSAPLGIDDFAWRRDERGHELGFSGGYTTTAAVAALGQLYLDHGVRDGERVLSEQWVEQATRSQVANPDEGDPDWQQGYGFQFWMARHGFRGDGAYGQFCVVLPEQDVVVAMTGQSADMQAVLDAVWQHLLPAVDRVGPTGDQARSSDADADAALRDRLDVLALPPASGAPLGASVRTGRREPATDDGTRASGLEAVELHRDDASAWTLTLVDESGSVRAPLGAGTWADDGVTASSAVVAADGTVAVEVRFVQTPHLLRIRCDPDGASFRAAWATQPLHDGVATLRRPEGPA